MFQLFSSTRRSEQRRQVFLATILILWQVLVPLGPVFNMQAAHASGNKVALCHATSSESNPYSNLNNPGPQIVSKNSIVDKDGNPKGHADHTGPVFPVTDENGNWGDIIPPFDAGNNYGAFEGLNWTEQGQAIYNNNCEPLETETETGSITIVKDAQPNSAQDFEFSFSGHNSSPILDDDTDPTRANNITFSGLTADTYNITETEVEGWTLDDVICTGAEQSTVTEIQLGVSIDLAAGEDVTCTFVNHETDQPVASINPIFECWTTDPNNDGRYLAYFGYENNTGEQQTVDYGPNNKVTPSSHQSEFPTTFSYPAGDIASRPGRTNFYPNAAIEITNWDGSNIVWSLTDQGTDTASINGPECPKPETGSITVIKDAQPNSEQDFDFRVIKNGDINDKETFTLDDDGDNTNDLSNQETLDELEPGTYRVQERNLADTWELAAVNCEGAEQSEISGVSAGREITLVAGEHITCTFVNEQSEPAAQLSLYKTIKPHGSYDQMFDVTVDREASDFSQTLTLQDGDEYGSQFVSENGFDDNHVAPGTYTVTETDDILDSPNWQLKAIYCRIAGSSDKADDFSYNDSTQAASFTLNQDEHVECQVVNTFSQEPPTDQCPVGTVPGAVRPFDMEDNNYNTPYTFENQFDQSVSAVLLEIVNEPASIHQTNAIIGGMLVSNVESHFGTATWLVSGPFTNDDLTFESAGSDKASARGTLTECDPLEEPESSITVIKHIFGSPNQDVFDFMINQNDGDSFSIQNLGHGDHETLTVPIGEYSIEELAGNEGVSLDDYHTSFHCKIVSRRISQPGQNLLNQLPLANTIQTLRTSDTTTDSYQLGDGDHLVCWFLNTELGDVVVTKFHDANVNGHFDAGEESVLDGWNVHLNKLFPYSHTSGTTGDGSNHSGQYVFENVKPGFYSISETPQDGWEQSTIYCHSGAQDVSREPTGLLSNLSNQHLHPSSFTYVWPGQTVECFIGNYQDLVIELEKDNDQTTPQRVGETITYTLEVTVPEDSGTSFDTQVFDLPPEGFEYIAGSWTANLNRGGTTTDLKANGTVVEPTYASPGEWNLRTMLPGDVITLTYQVLIESSVADGTYPDSAYATGYPTPEQNPDDIVYDNIHLASADNSPFVDTAVVVISDTEPTAEFTAAPNRLPNTGLEQWMGLITPVLAAVSYYWLVERKRRYNTEGSL